MAAKRIQTKGILVKLLEKGIRILVIKECKKIRNLKIDIVSSSFQIIRGEIQKINIFAEDIDYKEFFFDEIKLEANQIKINFKLRNQELFFENNPKIKFKVSLSQNSLRKILSSNSCNCIGDLISKEILNQEKFEDIIIGDNQLLMKASKKNIAINQEKQINIKADKGKIYLENKTYNKTIEIPIEDKIYIEKIKIENNLINIFANSSISF